MSAIGTKGKNNQGEEFEIIGLEYINEKCYYKVKFLETGYINNFTMSNINKGEIRDIYLKTIFNSCCLGNANARKDGKPTDEYKIWHNMVTKCFNQNNKKYKNYGAKGVTVCERWKCFEYFLEDIIKIPRYQLWKEEPRNYILYRNPSDHTNTYCLETCTFEHKSVNNLLMLEKRYANIDKYKGVTKNSSSYYVRVNSDNFGSYDSEIAAANIYNHVARYRGYNEHFLNDIPYMSRLECCNHRIENDEYNKQMIYELERQYSISEKQNKSVEMITILNEDKFNSFN